MFGARRWAQW